MQTGASWTDVNVRGRGLAGHRAGESVVGNPSRFQIAAHPNALLVAGVDGQVDAAAMIQPQRAMQAGAPVGANRQRMVEFLLERYRQRLQILRFEERATAFV